MARPPEKGFLLWQVFLLLLLHFLPSVFVDHRISSTPFSFLSGNERKKENCSLQSIGEHWRTSGYIKLVNISSYLLRCIGRKKSVLRKVALICLLSRHSPMYGLVPPWLPFFFFFFFFSYASASGFTHAQPSNLSVTNLMPLCSKHLASRLLILQLKTLPRPSPSYGG